MALNAAGIWMEAHKVDQDGETHFHYYVALRADSQFRFAPVKRALLLRLQLCPHVKKSSATTFNVVTVST